MNELDYIRKRYHNKSFIEINFHTQKKVFDWLLGSNPDGQTDIRQVCRKLCERGFIKFLDEAVLLIKPESPSQNTRIYPFKFRDDGMLQMSIYITNPASTNEYNSLELLCKIEVGIDTMFKVIDGTYNEDLAKAHIAVEFAAERIGLSNLTSIIETVSETSPHLKPDTKEWELEVSKEYFRSILKIQIFTVIGINAYLSLLQKDILISRIEQKREMKAGNSGGKRSKRNPLYRYVVELPPNYKPRKFDLNYVLSHWERAGHVVTRWVLPENAKLLAERRKGRVTQRFKGKYQAIEIPIEPKICYRKAKKVEENAGTKDYKP